MTEAQMKKAFVGKTIGNIYKGDGYWVIEFNGGGETSVRFMSEGNAQYNEGVLAGMKGALNAMWGIKAIDCSLDEAIVAIKEGIEEVEADLRKVTS